MLLTHVLAVVAMLSSFSISPTNAACKKINFGGVVELAPGHCMGFGTSSIITTCNPMNYTLTLFGTGDCTGAATQGFPVVLPLGQNDVCGVADTSCFVTLSSYSAGACVASELQFSAAILPDSCFGGQLKTFCAGNMTKMAFYTGAQCTGNVAGLITLDNNLCLRSQGTATKMGACSGGVVAPAGPPTAAGSAYVQTGMSTNSGCTNSVGTMVAAAGGTCVAGSKFYCESSATQVVSVSYSNGTLCTGEIVSVDRQDTTVCINAGSGYYQQVTCSAGSSAMTTSAMVTVSSTLVLDYYTDNTCATKSGSGTLAIGVCSNGDTEYTCSSATSATLSTYDSGSGACNASQVVPPIINVVLGTGVCANLKGQYVKVVSCGTSAAGRITGVFAIVLAVCVGYFSHFF